VRHSGNRSGRADRQRAGLDLGRQGGGFAADAAVEPVVVLAVDADSHPSAGVWPTWSSRFGWLAINHKASLIQCQNLRGGAMLRSRTPSTGRAHGLRVTLPRSLPTLPTTQSMASRLTGRLSSSCTVIGTGSRPSGRTAGWDRSDRSGRPWCVRYPAIRAADADWSSAVAGQDGRGFNGGSVLTGSPGQRWARVVIIGSRTVQARPHG